MLTFMATWNDFFWPLIVLTPQNPTVQVALSQPGRRVRAGLVAGPRRRAGVGTLPILIVFVLLGRQIVGGIMQGAVKG